MTTKDDQDQPAEKSFSLISNEKLLTLYAKLLKCRKLSTHAGSGRKASIAPAVAIANDLEPGDTLSANGTNMIARFVRGISLSRVLDGLSAERQPSSASIIKAAVRAARGHKAKRKKRIAVVFCSEPFAVKNVWQDSLREAAAKKLPILFVCWATPDGEEIESLTPDPRFPAMVVDANDVVAIYRVATEATALARRGSGPTLIVCQPWKASKGNKADPADTDPILNMENYLARKGLLTAELKAKTNSEFARELRAAASQI